MGVCRVTGFAQILREARIFVGRDHDHFKRKAHSFVFVYLELNKITRLKADRKLLRFRVTSTIEEGEITVILAPDDGTVLIMVTPKHYSEHASPNSKR